MKLLLGQSMALGWYHTAESCPGEGAFKSLHLFLISQSKVAVLLTIASFVERAFNLLFLICL